MFELKKCPKCGGTAKVWRYGQYDYIAECRKCDFKVVGDTLEEAINNWNRSGEDERNAI